MKKVFIGIFLLFGLFVCGCDDLKDALAFNRVTRTEQQGNISVRVCSYADTKVTVDGMNVLGTKVEKYEKIDFEKMYKSAKHEFKSSELRDENSKNVIPTVAKIKVSSYEGGSMLGWGLVKIDSTGNRAEIATDALVPSGYSKDEKYIYFSGGVNGVVELRYKNEKNPLPKGKYQVVIYTKVFDNNFKFTDKSLATWDFEII